MFDPSRESDEVVDDDYFYDQGPSRRHDQGDYQYEVEDEAGEQEEGLGGKLLKGLIKTASDDLRLVGNVIKLALSK